jgi:hypothetical protein
MNYIHVRDGLSLPANRRSEWHAVNEMKSALFYGTHKDRVASVPFAETFAAVRDSKRTNTRASTRSIFLGTAIN